MRLGDIDVHGQLPPDLSAVEVPALVLGGAEYVPCDGVSLHRSAGLVVFARTGLTGSIALDERSGEIVQLTNLRRRWISPSVTEFTALATSVAAWFDQSDNSLPSDRVIGFRPQVEARYPTSFTDSDGYWAALLDDIAIGDYDYR